MSPGRVMMGMVLGMVGGAVAECLDALFHLTHDPTGNTTAAPADGNFYVLGIILGLCIGAGLGATEGIYSGTRTRFTRAALYGALGGALCGYLGFGIGSLLYKVLGGDPSLQPSAGAQLQQVLARTASWGLMGMLVGVVGGLPGLSLPRMRNGAVGGFIGGCIGGFVLQNLMTLGVFQGFQLRLIAFGLTGASIGFFVGLVGEVFKRAWVKVLVGRNEGREHVIDGPVAVIGRSELADVPVFLDPGLAARQASIRHQGGRYHLFDEAGKQDTRWRGQVVANGQPLTDGDLIQVGNVTLVFYEKATATAGSRAPAAPLAAAGIPARGGAVCEFCGSPRDPVTGACACSPVAPAAAGYPAPGFAAPGDAATLYAAPGGYPAGPAGGVADDPFSAYSVAADSEQTVAVGGMDPGMGGGWGGGPRLVGLSGPYTGMQVPMGAAVLTIGREAGRDITLAGDATASRRHAAVYNQGSYFLLRDEGSSNGTFVNGARVGEHALQPGDEIRIGGSSFRFEA